MKLSVLYGSEEGKKFQLATVDDVNYRTEENPDSIAKVENSHAYEYDANGNLIYVNTGRLKSDGDACAKNSERKLIWKEENRLLASDDNGLACAQFRLRSAMLKQCLTLHSLARKVVTNYWYNVKAR